jgi:hypothetical protein
MAKANVSLLMLASLLLMVAAAAAQTGVDLSVASIGVDVSGDEFRIMPQIQLSAIEHYDPVPIEIEIRLDGTLSELLSSTAQFIQENHTCYNYNWPDCGSGQCLDLYAFLNNYYGGCHDWQLFRCACNWVVEPVAQWVPYAGQLQCTVIVDPYFTVQEMDESNNEMTINLQPVQSEGRTWSAVKGLYR